jgi:transposase-like protein
VICEAPHGRWVTDRELAQILGVHPQTLRNWRWRDRKDGRRRGGLIYRYFGPDVVRYYLSPDLIDPRGGPPEELSAA